MRLLANRSPGKGAEAGQAAFLPGPQLARGVGADFVHLGQDDPAAAGGLDGTVIGCVDQPRCVQASEITAKIADVSVAVDGGEAGRGDVPGQQGGPQLAEHAHCAGRNGSGCRCAGPASHRPSDDSQREPLNDRRNEGRKPVR